MKPLAEVVEALGCQGIVVVLPGEAGLDVAFGGERLHGFDYLWASSVSQRNIPSVGCGGNSPYVEILSINRCMIGEVEVFLCDEDAL